MPEYPEHEKMKKARARGSEEIGLFLEWVRSGESPYVIAQWEQWRACESESWNVKDGAPTWRCVDGHIMKGPDFTEVIDECTVCDGKGRFKPQHPDLLLSTKSILDILSEYFDIDQDRIEDEKRMMLNEIEERNRET